MDSRAQNQAISSQALSRLVLGIITWFSIIWSLNYLTVDRKLNVLKVWCLLNAGIINMYVQPYSRVCFVFSWWNSCLAPSSKIPISKRLGNRWQQLTRWYLQVDTFKKSVAFKEVLRRLHTLHFSVTWWIEHPLPGSFSVTYCQASDSCGCGLASVNWNLWNHDPESLYPSFTWIASSILLKDENSLT